METILAVIGALSILLWGVTLVLRLVRGKSPEQRLLEEVRRQRQATEDLLRLTERALSGRGSGEGGR